MRSFKFALIVALVPIATTAEATTPVLSPDGYVAHIDEIAFGDSPQFFVGAGPGGNQLQLGVPGRVRFDGFIEDHTGIGDFAVPVRMFIVADRPDMPLSYEVFDLPAGLLPPTPPGEPPVRAPLHVDFLLPYSSPHVDLHFEARYDYVSPPGMRIAGTLTYAIGVPEPATQTSTLIALLAAGLLAIRARRARIRN
jgi:hypothetical protein